jgi:hypothetical protein
MVKHLLGIMSGHRQKARFKQYRYAAQALSDPLLTAEVLPGLLCQFWRQLDLNDILHLDAKRVMNVHVNLAHRNLPELVTFFTEYNDAIAQEQDVDTMMKNCFNDNQSVNLDLYLADSNGFPIDLKGHLVRLQGKLLQHCDLLNLQTTQYYQRQAERVYRDVVKLSTVLVSVITEE